MSESAVATSQYQCSVDFIIALSHHRTIMLVLNIHVYTFCVYTVLLVSYMQCMLDYLLFVQHVDTDV